MSLLESHFTILKKSQAALKWWEHGAEYMLIVEKPLWHGLFE